MSTDPRYVQTSQPDDEAYGKSGEVAEILHVSSKTVSRWAKEGKLPYRMTMGGHRRYPLNQIRQIANDLGRAVE